MLKGLSEFSHEAVRHWFRIPIEALPRPQLRRRASVAVNETKLKLREEQLYV